MSKLHLVPALAVLLAGCSAPTGEAGTAAAPDAAATPVASAEAPPSPTQQEEKGMHKECNGARLSLTALPATDEPTRTRLEFEKDGQRRVIETPAELSDYTAVGLACAEDSQGTSYFVVQYGEVEAGCSFCEWFYLYDAQGKQLTQSVPPLKGEQDEQSPNNDEYSQLIAKLGITHPEVDYIED